MGYKDALSSVVKTLSISTFNNLFHIIWPLYISLLVQRLVGPINLVFAGRIGAKELEVVRISHCIFSAAANGLSSGLAVSFATIAAKAYGAGKYHIVGILLQKAFLFASCLCILVTSLWIHIGGLLTVIGIPVDIAEKAEKYLLIYIPSMLGIFAFRLLRAYLMIHEKPIPSSVTACIGVILLSSFNYVFIYVFRWGIAGLTIANDMSHCLTVALIVLYILVTRIYEDTWPGLTTRCLLKWKTYLTLALPAVLSFVLKSSVHEIALIAIGRLGHVQIAAQACLFTLMKALLTLPFAIAMPINIIVSKNFGKNNVDESRRTVIVGCFLNLVASLVFAAAFIASKNVFGKVFTNDVEVISLISHVTPFATFSFLLESTTTVLLIISLSFGLQFYSIIIYFITCYLIGLPIGISLALYKEDITLLWCGLAVGFCAQFFLFSVLYFWKVDFEMLSKEKQEANEKGIKQKVEYSPLKVYDDAEQEVHPPTVNSNFKYGLEKEESIVGGEAIPIHDDVDSDSEKSVAEGKDVPSFEEEVTLQRCSVFGIVILCLFISIVIRVQVRQ